MNVTTSSFVDKTIGEIVAEDFRKAEVFNKYGIDFCCGGGKTLSQACAEQGVDPNKLLVDLQKTASTGCGMNRFNQWNLEFLIDYIIYNHHEFLKEELPTLSENLHKVVRVHGANHPEVIDLAERFNEVKTNMEAHLKKEEQILFPLLKRLANIKNEKDYLKEIKIASVSSSILAMESEHERAGKALDVIRIMSDNYTLPVDACQMFACVYDQLKGLEQDFHQHIHLENNVLFPKALAIQQEIIVDLKMT